MRSHPRLTLKAGRIADGSADAKRRAVKSERMPEPIFKDTRFDALRNAIYHTERRAFLDLLNRSLNFLVVLLGASVAVKAATAHGPVREYWLELAVVFVATAQLVFDFGSKARTHEFLQKRYYEMLSEMETSDFVSEKAKSRWSAKLLTIAADEPITMRALDALAYNKAIDAWISDPQEAANCRLYVPWWQRRLRHILAFQGVQFLPNASHQGLIKRCVLWWRSRRRQHGEEIKN
jgi:hypothetical protein